MRVLLLFSVGERQPHVPLMLASVRKHMPDYRIVQITDNETLAYEVDEVVRRWKEPDLPIFAFRTACFASCPYNKWLALDGDILVRRDVQDVWARNFDVALTTRRKIPCPDPNGVDVRKTMPFNTGVIFSRSPEFWQECLDLMKPPYEHGWYTDQWAVAKVAEQGKYHVLVLPGEEFNFTPVVEDEASEARFLHFKGKRKDWMMRHAS